MKPQFRSNPFLRPTHLTAGLGLALCVAGLSSSAWAGSAVWNGATGAQSWNTNANWTPNTTFPNGVGETATVTKDLAGDTTINLSQAITVGTLLLGDNDSSNTYTIAPNGAFSLTFDNTGSTNAVLTDSPASGVLKVDTVSSGIILADSLDITTGINTVSLTGVISEATAGKALTKSGAGLLELRGANTYTGTTTLSNGTIEIFISSAGAVGAITSGPLGRGGLTINGGSLNARTASRTVFNALTVGGDFALNGTSGGGNKLTVSGPVGLGAANRTLTVIAAGGAELSNIVSGTGGLTKAGASTLTLSGANTYNGGTTVSDGTLVINADAALGAIPGSPATNLTFSGNSTFRQPGTANTTALNANRSIVINSGVTATYHGGLNGNVLTINGSISNQSSTGTISLPTAPGGTTTALGTLVLAGSNNFAAGTAVSLGAAGNNVGGGILRLANNNALGANAVTINATAAAGQTMGEAAVELSGGITVPNTVTYNIGGHGNQTLAAGDNLRNFSGNNIFNAPINLTTTGGGYQIDSADATGLLTINGNINSTISNVSQRTLNIIGAGNTSVTGIISQTGNNALALTKLGAGTLTLSGANTFNGPLTLTTGTLNLNSATAAGAAASTFVINDGTTIDNTSGAAKTLSNNNPLTLNGNFTFSTGAGTTANDLSLGGGATTLGTTAGTTRTITTNGAGVLTIAGAIANGTTANSITKLGTGNLMLSGANTYTGGTTFSSGQLHINNGAALGTGPLAISGGTILARFGNKTIGNAVNIGGDFTIGLNNINNRLTFTGNVDLGGTVRNINVFNLTDAQDAVMSGVVSNGALTKSGSGTLTLGGANTYFGATLINGGTLLLNNANPSNSSSVSVNGSDAKFVVDGVGTISAPVTVTQGGVDGTATLNSVVVANAVGNTVSAGDGLPGVLTVGSLTFQGAATLNLFNTDQSNVQKLIVTDLATNATDHVVVNATTSVAWSNGNYPLIQYTNYPSAPDASHFSLTQVQKLDPSQHAELINANSAIMLKITSDALVWTGNQSTDWTTAPVGGSMNWNDNGTPAEYTDGRSVSFDDTSGHYGVNLASNVSPTAVIFNSPFENYTLSSTGGFGITGSASVVKNGFLTATLATNNSYTGPTSVNNGTLEVTGSIASSSAISVVSGATLNLNLANSPNVYSNPITASGTVAKNGVGSLSLTGANSLGPVTMNDGTLTINGAGSISGLITMNAGTLTLAGTTANSGQITLNGGLLNIGTATALNAGGGVFINSGVIDNTSGAALVAGGNRVQQWAGDFTFAGTNNLDMGSGTVTISGGSDRTMTFAGAGDILTVGEIKSVGNEGLTLVGGGTLVATSDGVFDDASKIGGTLTVGANTTLQINRSTGNNGDFTATGLAGTGTIINGMGAGARSLKIDTASTQTFGGTIANGGAGTLALVKAGVGTLILTGSNSYSGLTQMDNGILDVRSNNALGASQVRMVGNARSAAVHLQGGITIPSSVTWTLSNDGIGVAAIGYAINNVLDNNTINGVITMTSGGGGTVIQSTSGALTLAGNITSDQSRALTLQGASTAANKVSGVISNGTSGTNTLTKAGTGTWTLTATNTYTGVTTINDGTLQLGDGITDGTIANTSGVTDNGTLVYNWATSHTAGYIISGTGAVIKNGAGTATLAGANTYTGTTTVNAGELAVNGSSIADANTVVINGGKVNVTGTEIIDKLFVNGIQQPFGNYTAANSFNIISGGGTLVVNSGPPATSPYDSFLSAHNLPANTPMSEDTDKDGYNNLAEFILGGEPNPNNAGSNTDNLAPTVSKSGNNHVFSFRRNSLAASQPNLTVEYQYGSNMMSDWIPVPVGMISAPVVGAYGSAGYGGGTIDRIDITIPDNDSHIIGGKVFVRMHAAIP